MMRLPLCAALLTAAAFPALANDGWGGISATGLVFGQTEDIAMMDEDLYIGIDDIRVSYVFKNTSDKDVTGEVIFPLPPINIAATTYSEFSLPEDRNAADLVGFTATLDGVAQPVTIDRIAVMEPLWDEAAPLAQVYDSPGTDVTARLEGLGLPLSVDTTVISDAILALPEAEQQKLVAEGLVEIMEASGDQPAEALALWSVILRYHWTQTFPAGAEVAIQHAYANRSPGGLFSWADPPDEYRQPEVDRYCIDAGTSKAMAERLIWGEGEEQQTMGVAHNIAYVLRTANSWAGPIGHFKLTIDKGAAENIVSLCAEGLEKTSPTTFVMEKTDFTPDRDLEILIVGPMDWQR